MFPTFDQNLIQNIKFFEYGGSNYRSFVVEFYYLLTLVLCSSPHIHASVFFHGYE